MSTNYIQAIIERNKAQAQKNLQMLHGLKRNLAVLQHKINGLNTAIIEAEEQFVNLTEVSNPNAAVRTMQPAAMHLVAS